MPWQHFIEPFCIIKQPFFESLNCAPARVDYRGHWLTSRGEMAAAEGSPAQPAAIILAQKPIIGTIKAHERVLSREGSVCPTLDRYAFQLHRDPRFRLSLPEWTIRDDRP